MKPARSFCASACLLMALGLASVAGCARALREPPSFSELTGEVQRNVSPEEVDGLLVQAREDFEKRTLEDARRAARVWLRAAAADPGRTEGLIGTARAEIWISGHAPDPDAREAAASRAVQAAQWCERIAPGDAACHYWLGAALGVQARERKATALSALPAIEAAFKRAAASAPSLEEAGPDRALALLYIRAPGWPSGLGDPELGLAHARKAMARRPGYPPNHLALAEALAVNGDRAGALSEYRHALALSESRREAGDLDAVEWVHEAERGIKTLE